MIGLAAGMTIGGKIPFTGTFANFSTGRVYDQIRQSVAYSGKNVKICASHAGLTLGEDGATHQILEDIGMMKMLPGMTVINPCDYNQTKAATLAVAEHAGPVYLRFGRPAVPVFMPENSPFIIGKAVKLQDGADLSIFAAGHMVWESLQAAEILHEAGIHAEVINIHTIKPLDEEAVLESARKNRLRTHCRRAPIQRRIGRKHQPSVGAKLTDSDGICSRKRQFRRVGHSDSIDGKIRFERQKYRGSRQKSIDQKSGCFCLND